MTRPRSGFTLVEVIVTVAVLGIVGGAIGHFNAVQWRREQANAAALQLATWLEEIALSPEEDGQPCRVTLSFGSGPATLAPGSVLARVEPDSCSQQPELRLPGLLQNNAYHVAASQPSWTFTPRGAVITGSDLEVGSNNDDIQIRFSLLGLPPSRCVRLTGQLGLVRLGRNNLSGNPSEPCSDWNLL